MNTELVYSPGKHQCLEEEGVTTRPCPRPRSLDLGAALTVDAHQVSMGLDEKPLEKGWKCPFLP